MLTELRAAFAFLTIVPLRWPDDVQPGRAFAWFPLVGLVIGGLLAGLAWLPLLADVRAFVVLLAWVVITGGLHLDGFGDSCDGLLATVPPERRLAIMKDPRAGSWAVIGLILLLLGKWLLIGHLLRHPLLLVIVPVMGRWALVLAAYAYPYARSSGLGGMFRDGLGRPQIVIATMLALLSVSAVACMVSYWALLVLIVPLLVVGLMGRWAAGRLGGGLTGDVYGALCELTELLTLWLLVEVMRG